MKSINNKYDQREITPRPKNACPKLMSISEALGKLEV